MVPDTIPLGRRPMHDVVFRRHHRRTNLVVGATLAVALAGTLASCGSTSKNPAAPVTAVSTPPTSTGDIAAAIHLADLQNATRTDTVYSVGAQPSFELVDGKAKVTPLHSSNVKQWEPGDYRLVVRCIGTGTLTVELQIGEYLTWTTLPGCSDTSSAGVLGLTLPRHGTGMSVTVSPSADTRAAVAYQVRLLPD